MISRDYSSLQCTYRCYARPLQEVASDLFPFSIRIYFLFGKAREDWKLYKGLRCLALFILAPPLWLRPRIRCLFTYLFAQVHFLLSTEYLARFCAASLTVTPSCPYSQPGNAHNVRPWSGAESCGSTASKGQAEGKLPKVPTWHNMVRQGRDSSTSKRPVSRPAFLFGHLNASMHSLIGGWPSSPRTNGICSPEHYICRPGLERHSV